MKLANCKIANFRFCPNISGKKWTLLENIFDNQILLPRKAPKGTTNGQKLAVFKKIINKKTKSHFCLHTK